MNLRHLNPTMEKLLRQFQLDKTYVRGEGQYLYDQEGKKYLDFIAQYGAVPLGYNPPGIIEAAKKFLDSGLPTMVQPSVPLKAAELAEVMVKLAPGEMAQATFCQSGAEAVEAAIKLARSTTGKPKIITTKNSFHGKTMGALSATGRPVYQKPFYAPVPGFEMVPFNDINALEEKIRREKHEVAAFMVEPIQGEGGIVIPSEGYLKEAELLCRKHGLLFIVDEIQTGLGRTGLLFACEREEVQPDILLLSKALGGGLVPLGVCLSSKRAWNDEFGQLHSSTFANNNFTCSIGLAVLEELMKDDRKLIKAVEGAGFQLLHGLKKIAAKFPGPIKDIRGRGLMVGVEFNDFDGSESFSIKYMAEQGGFSALLSGYLLYNQAVRCAPFLNNPMTLRLQPALNVSSEQINIALKAIKQVVEILYYQDYSELYGFLIGRQEQSVRNYRQKRKPVISSPVKDSHTEKEKFAFLIHYPSAEDVIKNNPSFEKYNGIELERFLDWEASVEAKPEVIIHMPAVRSKAGKVAEGWLIGVPYSGRHLSNMPRKDAVKVLKDAVDLAKSLGAGIVGLGAYTSVVSRGGSDLQGRGVAITSGNSYTVATAFEALMEGANMMGIDRSRATGSVIGATGAIGRVCALLLTDEIEQLYLVGNPAKEKTSLRRLEKLADEIYERAFRELMQEKSKLTRLTGIARWIKQFLNYLNKTFPGTVEKLTTQVYSNKAFSFTEFINKHLPQKGKLANAPIKVTVNIQQALMRSDLVISASNSTSDLIGPGHLKPGSVVCDVARPADVSKAVLESRKDVLVIEGGLVRLPDKICFGQNMGYEPGINLACLSETMLMALEGDYRDISIGLKLALEDVYYLRQLAAKHGFKLAMPKNERGAVTGYMADEVRKAALVGTNIGGENA